MKAYKWQAVDLSGNRIEGEGHTPEDCAARAAEFSSFSCEKNFEPEASEAYIKLANDLALTGAEHVHTEDAFPVAQPELQPSKVDKILADQAFRLDITTLITAWWVTQKANALGMGDALIRPDFVEFIGLE